MLFGAASPAVPQSGSDAANKPLLRRFTPEIIIELLLLGALPRFGSVLWLWAVAIFFKDQHLSILLHRVAYLFAVKSLKPYAITDGRAGALWDDIARSLRDKLGVHWATGDNVRNKYTSLHKAFVDCEFEVSHATDEQERQAEAILQDIVDDALPPLAASSRPVRVFP